jgi:hypothetical protein
VAPESSLQAATVIETASKQIKFQSVILDIIIPPRRIKLLADASLPHAKHVVQRGLARRSDGANSS